MPENKKPKTGKMVGQKENTSDDHSHGTSSRPNLAGGINHPMISYAWHDRPRPGRAEKMQPRTRYPAGD